MMVDEGDAGDDSGIMDWSEQGGNEGVDMSMMDEEDTAREDDDLFPTNSEERDWRGEVRF